MSGEPVWALREIEEGQRHSSEEHGTGRCHKGNGRSVDSNQRSQRAHPKEVAAKKPVAKKLEVKNWARHDRPSLTTA